MNGRAMEGVAVKLVSLPALGYSTEDKPWPRGEMWVQSKTLSPGYYKNKARSTIRWNVVENSGKCIY